MITKYTTADRSDVHVMEPRQLQKTASFEHIPQDRYRTDDGYLYVMVRSISSRVNKNYDGWPGDQLAGFDQDSFRNIVASLDSPEQEKSAATKVGRLFTSNNADSSTKFGYKTFNGRPAFVDHNNTDPRRARGVVVDSALYIEPSDKRYSSSDYWSNAPENHKPETWVELLIEVDGKSYPKLATAIKEGRVGAVSMGANVTHTKCSICDNTARTVDEYCSHIQHKGIPYITASGIHKTAYEDCYNPNFFEISFVFDPADVTAQPTHPVISSIEKEASIQGKVFRYLTQVAQVPEEEAKRLIMSQQGQWVNNFFLTNQAEIEASEWEGGGSLAEKPRPNQDTYQTDVPDEQLPNLSPEAEKLYHQLQPHNPSNAEEIQQDRGRMAIDPGKAPTVQDNDWLNDNGMRMPQTGDQFPKTASPRMFDDDEEGDGRFWDKPMPDDEAVGWDKPSRPFDQERDQDFGMDPNYQEGYDRPDSNPEVEQLLNDLKNNPGVFAQESQKSQNPKIRDLGQALLRGKTNIQNIYDALMNMAGLGSPENEPEYPEYEKSITPDDEDFLSGNGISPYGHVKQAEYNGWTNWETWNTALIMDNEYDTYQAVRRAWGLSINDSDDLANYLIQNVIGPYNQERIKEAQEWNGIHPDERIDYNYEDLKERNPQAADLVDQLGFGADTSDTEPQIIDYGQVDFNEIYQGLVEELGDPNGEKQEPDNDGSETGYKTSDPRDPNQGQSDHYSVNKESHPPRGPVRLNLGYNIPFDEGDEYEGLPRHDQLPPEPFNTPEDILEPNFGNIPGTWNVPKAKPQKTAGGEVTAPSRIDTLREEAHCPFDIRHCGMDESGMCDVCGFEAPPEGLGDPDIEAAQESLKKIEEARKHIDPDDEVALNVDDPEKTENVGEDDGDSLRDLFEEIVQIRHSAHINTEQRKVNQQTNYGEYGAMNRESQVVFEAPKAPSNAELVAKGWDITAASNPRVPVAEDGKKATDQPTNSKVVSDQMTPTTSSTKRSTLDSSYPTPGTGAKGGNGADGTPQFTSEQTGGDTNKKNAPSGGKTFDDGSHSPSKTIENSYGPVDTSATGGNIDDPQFSGAEGTGVKNDPDNAGINEHHPNKSVGTGSNHPVPGTGPDGGNGADGTPQFHGDAEGGNSNEKGGLGSGHQPAGWKATNPEESQSWPDGPGKKTKGNPGEKRVSHLFNSMRLVDAEIDLGILKHEAKYNRVAELESASETYVATRLATIQQIKEAGIVSTSSSRKTSAVETPVHPGGNLPSFKQVASGTKTELPDEAIFSR